MATAPAIGRKTNGGLEITSKPLSVAATGEDDGVSVTVTVGDGEGDSLGVGDGEGDVGGALMVKLAHGLGCTLAHRWCTPGGSPENGLTLTLLKLPFWSAVAEPATWLATSQ